MLSMEMSLRRYQGGKCARVSWRIFAVSVYELTIAAVLGVVESSSLVPFSECAGSIGSVSSN